MGVDTYTTKWTRITAHAGGILENIIQAVALDVLNVWIKRVNHAGINIIGHVHDELLTVAHDFESENTLNMINYLASQTIPWAPGLKLNAAGYVAER